MDAEERTEHDEGAPLPVEVFDMAAQLIIGWSPDLVHVASIAAVELEARTGFRQSEG